jgi:hypothetical protein
MAYTTEAEVETILASEYDATVAPSLVPFIDAAAQLVEEICVPVGYTEARLEMIERYLAAHFYAITKPRLQTENIDSLQNTIQSKVDLGLNLSHYGSQAMVLDTSGGLARLNAQSTSKDSKTTLGVGSIGVVWLGTENRNPYAG